MMILKGLVVVLLAALVSSQQMNVAEIAEEMAWPIADLLDSVIENLMETVPHETLSQDPLATRHLYDQMADIVRGMLSGRAEVLVPQVGNESTPIQMTNLSITGLDATSLVLEPTGSGFDINNFTMSLPGLNISADHYLLDNFNLANLLILSGGGGTVRIELTDIYFMTKLKVKYWTGRKEFEVQAINWWECYLKDAKFQMENLGGAGEAMSALLNSVATDIVPVFVRSLNATLNEMEKDSPEWLQFSKAAMPAISKVMNTVLKSALG